MLDALELDDTPHEYHKVNRPFVENSLFSVYLRWCSTLIP